jgi:hypothetical protein
MNSKLFILLTILALFVGATFVVVGCGDDDDDDDSGDDTSTDDDGGDDTAASECATGLTVIYDDCGLTLADADSNPISFDDAVALCESGDTVAACAAACGLASTDCDDVTTCFNDSCAA